MKSFPQKKVAIVADWLTSRGGAEHVVLALADLFENVEVFTSVYNEDLFPEFRPYRVHTSFLQKLPAFLRHKHQFLLPFFPRAFRQFDFSEFDILISSSSSGFSKCVQKTRKDQIHICYCHTPIRFLYNARKEYLQTYPLPWFARPVKWILPFLLNQLEKIDQKAISGVDYFISNSHFVGNRIKTYYNRDSKTIHPGIDTTPYIKNASSAQKKSYYLGVGRFIPYKKFDLLVDTFIANKKPLKLAGIGPEYDRCRQKARDHNASNIEFLGFTHTKDLPRLYAEAKALIFPSEEDFGLVPVESLSSGTPVLYYNKGGACESVGGMPYGVPFDAQTVESLQKSIDWFESHQSEFDGDTLSNRGQKFDVRMFQKNLETYIQSLLS